MVERCLAQIGLQCVANQTILGLIAMMCNGNAGSNAVGIDVAERRDGVHRSAAVNDARGHHKRPSAQPQHERSYILLLMLDALNS